MRIATAVVAAALLFCAAPTARAEPRSWTALKRAVHPGAQVVVSVDLVPLRKTAAYRLALQQLMSRDQVRGIFDLVKTTCGLDVAVALTDATVVVTKIGPDEIPLMAFGLDGADATSLPACLEKVASKHRGSPATLRATRKGKITSYALSGEAKLLHVAWLARGVVALTDDPNDRARLDKVLTGKAPRGALGKLLTAVPPSAALWLAAVREEPIPGAGTMRGVTGAVTVTGGALAVAGRVVMATPAEATTLHTLATTTLSQLGPELGKQAPALAPLLTSLRLAAVGDRVEATVTVDDKQLEALVPLLAGAL